MPKNLQKIVALIFCFFIIVILFRGCKFIYDGVIDILFEVIDDLVYVDPEEDYFYEVSWYFQGDGADAGERVPDEYYFRIYKTIYQYSVAAQELTQVLSSEDGGIDAYAINDDYIFFITGANTGPNAPAAKLWKYDRMADTCELFTEISKHNSSLALYGGYVFYGEFGDINACPIDGNPEEDCINLLAQFPEDVSAYEMPDIVYQGWHIRRKSNSGYDKILFIKDQENNQVILAREDVWLDVNGELIHFTESGYGREYQRENEPEKRSIDCLQDYVYISDGATIRRDRLGVEDGKIICLLTVVEVIPYYYEVPQNRVGKDILFEIDLEADSSRVIYATEGNKTRIIGYRGGTLYLLENDIIYRESLEDGDREEVFDLRDGSVALYGSDGRHTSIYFIVWGDNLIVSPYDRTKGMFTIPLFDQAEDSQEEMGNERK